MLRFAVLQLFLHTLVWSGGGTMAGPEAASVIITVLRAHEPSGHIRELMSLRSYALKLQSLVQIAVVVIMVLVIMAERTSTEEASIVAGDAPCGGNAAAPDAACSIHKMRHRKKQKKQRRGRSSSSEFSSSSSSSSPSRKRSRRYMKSGKSGMPKREDKLMKEIRDLHDFSSLPKMHLPRRLAAAPKWLPCSSRQDTIAYEIIGLLHVPGCIHMSCGILWM